MIKQFNSGQILKGSDVEIGVPLATCRLDVDVREAQDLVVSIYTTPGGASIQKTIEDIELNEKGDAGLIHIEWEELDGLDDGVVRYNVFYVYDGDAVEFEGSTGYFLKTPIDYTPTTFVSEENLDELVEDKLIEEGTATEDYVDSVIAEATSGLASEAYVDNAVSGLASEQYVDTAVSGLASETYVNSAISAIDDYCIFLGGTQYWEVSESEVNRLIDYLNSLGNDYGKARIFIMVDGHYVEFRAVSVEYYDGVEAALVYSVFSRQYNIFYNVDRVLFYYGKLKRGTSIQRNQSDGGLRETYIDATELGDSTDTFTYILPSSNNLMERRAIIAKAAEYYENGKDYQGIRVVYDGHVYRVEQYVPPGDYEANVSCTCLDTTYTYNSRIYIRVIDFGTMDRDVVSRTEEINLATFATTAQTVALEQQIQNLPASTAMTQAINSAITASNLVYALTGTNKIWAGTRAAYSAQTIDNTTLYFIID